MAKDVIYVPSCHSTNLLAEQLLADNRSNEGDIIITDNQTQGRGQLNKSWESEPGKNLTFSLLLKPGFLNPEFQFYLNIVVSLALKNTVSNLTGSEPKIKWPNDLIIQEKKISGILIKNFLEGKKIKSSIIGIGLNVNQCDFKTGSAISMRQVGRKEFVLPAVFTELIENLETRYIQLCESKWNALKDEYTESLFGINEVREFESEKKFSGAIKGIDNRGLLIIESEGKSEKFSLNRIKYIFRTA